MRWPFTPLGGQVLAVAGIVIFAAIFFAVLFR